MSNLSYLVIKYGCGSNNFNDYNHYKQGLLDYNEPSMTLPSASLSLAMSV